MNLTSPVSSTHQWLVKNIIATLTALSGTMLLFLVISQLTGKKLDLIPLKILNESGSFLALCGALLFILVQISFWASTVANRIVHAAFLAAASVMAFAAIFNMSMWVGNRMPILVQEATCWLMAKYQLSQWTAERSLAYLIVWSFLIASATTVPTGLACFRRLQSEQQNLKQSLKLSLAAIMVTGILMGAAEKSVSSLGFKASPLYQETEAAFVSLNAHVPTSTKAYHRDVTYDELVATGKLSEQTQAWLRNCKLRVDCVQTEVGPYITAIIFFPTPERRQQIFLNPRIQEMPAYNEKLRDRLKQR